MNEHLSAATTPSPPASSRHETTAVCGGARLQPADPPARHRPAGPVLLAGPAGRVRTGAKRAKDMPITVEVDYGSATSRGRPAAPHGWCGYAVATRR